MSRREEDIEREQIEWLFGLTGGELNDEPWGGFRYNYDGVPEWAQRDYPDRDDWNVRYRTVIGDFLFGEPPAEIGDDEGVWIRQRTYRSSGETECPGRPELVKERRCPLCDESKGQEHGYIYLGDGMAEVVYRLELPEDNA